MIKLRFLLQKINDFDKIRQNLREFLTFNVNKPIKTI